MFFETIENHLHNKTPSQLRRPQCTFYHSKNLEFLIQNCRGLMKYTSSHILTHPIVVFYELKLE
jgi:hypothetical protein